MLKNNSFLNVNPFFFNMKKLFIEAKHMGEVKVNKKDAAKLPEKIGLATTVQFVDCIEDVKKQLKSKKVFVGKGTQKSKISGTTYGGRQKYNAQILGCDVSSAEKIKDKVDAFLYVGTGSFHPIALGLLEKDVYVLNPVKGNIVKLDKNNIEDYKKKRKGAMIKFLSAKNVGVLVSTKPGQRFYHDRINDIEKKYKDKKFYKFVFDNLDINQLENFPFVDSWVNTACPRLDEDVSLVNILELR